MPAAYSPHTHSGPQLEEVANLLSTIMKMPNIAYSNAKGAQ